MNDLITKVINWSESWSLLIPIIIILLYKPQGPGIKYLTWYVAIAFVLNTIATIMVEYYFSMPSWLKNNNILYNLHSFIRVLFFSLYIMKIRQYRYSLFLKLLLVSYFIFVAVNFIFFNSPLLINTYHFSAESIVLLIFSLTFFFRSMQDDSHTNWLKHPAFLVCTGICLYEVTSFFIFLFFYPLFEKNPEFGDLTLSIHNVMYTLFCILLAMALYKRRKNYLVSPNSKAK